MRKISLTGKKVQMTPNQQTSRLTVGRHFFLRYLMRVSLEGDTRMHSPQHNSTSNQTSNPDVVVSHLGTLYTFCPLTLRAKE